MEKVKNTIIMEIFNLKVNIQMEKDGMVKDMIYMEIKNLKSNMEKDMEKNILIEVKYNLKENF